LATVLAAFLYNRSVSSFQSFSFPAEQNSVTLEMEAVHSSKTLEQIYVLKQYNNPEDNCWNTGRHAVRKRAMFELHFIFLSQSASNMYMI
jgi:hypothetical protein